MGLDYPGLWEKDFDKRLVQEKEFARRLVHYDDFYGSYAITFDHYDEEMYDFVKDGPTTRNRHSKRREEGEPCAMASDWYAIWDQQVVGNNVREAKKRRRRKGKVNQRKLKRSEV